MNPRDREQVSEQECAAVLARLFPRGLAGEDVIAEVAPEGWERSPLLAVYHPSVEQVYRESIRLHRSLERLAGSRPTGPAPSEPTLEEIRERWHDEPIDREREGTMWINDRADLSPGYAMIFRRLATHGYDWEYAFPRIHAIDFGHDGDEIADLADRMEQDRQRAELHEILEAGHREALELAKDRLPWD